MGIKNWMARTAGPILFILANLSLSLLSREMNWQWCGCLDTVYEIISCYIYVGPGLYIFIWAHTCIFEWLSKLLAALASHVYKLCRNCIIDSWNVCQWDFPPPSVEHKSSSNFHDIMNTVPGYLVWKVPTITATHCSLLSNLPGGKVKQ